MQAIRPSGRGFSVMKVNFLTSRCISFIDMTELLFPDYFHFYIQLQLQLECNHPKFYYCLSTYDHLGSQFRSLQVSEDIQNVEKLYQQ